MDKISRTVFKRRIAISLAVLCLLSATILTCFDFGLFTLTSSHNKAPTQPTGGSNTMNIPITTNKSSTASPKVSAPTTSTPSTPAKSSSTGSGDTGETQFIQTEIQATNQENCTDYHSDTLYAYQTDVNKLAAGLGSNEDEDYNQYTQSNGIETFATLINAVDFDISSTNSTISSDWNINFVTSEPPVDCSITPSVPLLQVPTCDATDAGGISSCISQIDTSLDI
jgi:hypothetical protein